MVSNWTDPMREDSMDLARKRISFEDKENWVYVTGSLERHRQNVSSIQRGRKKHAQMEITDRETGSSQNRVLVIPFPSQGHINPMLQFSKRLAAKDRRRSLGITLVTTSTTKFSALSQPPTSVSVEYLPDDSDDDQPDDVGAFFRRFEKTVTEGLPGLVERLKNSGSPARVVVYDSIIPWVLDIAHPLGLKGACFFTQTCAVCAIYYHVHRGTLTVPSEEEEENHRSSVTLPGMPLMEIKDLPSFVYDIDQYPYALRLLLAQFSNTGEAEWIFFNTFDKLEHEVIDNWAAREWPRMKSIGPTIPLAYLEEEDNTLQNDIDYGLNLLDSNFEACMNWLDAKETASVAYVSFGSVANLNNEQMEELAWGLISSGTHFLWVVRASEESKLPPNFTDRALENGLIVNWCPQLQVLAHRAVGCFVTHCGWNSTLEALSLGVPLVAMPHWSDQTTNAKYVSDVWKVGVRARGVEKGAGVVGRAEIERCVKEVMEGESGDEVRRNAVRWKELAREAVAAGGSSDNNIQEFVSQLVKL